MSSTNVRIPERMLPLSALAGAVQVVSGPVLRLDGEGDAARPKENAAFPGRQAYRLTVEVVAGQRTKTLPDGSEASVYDLRTETVTVWTDSGAPACQPGDYVVLRGLMAGAMERGWYLWALAVEKLEAKR